MRDFLKKILYIFGPKQSLRFFSYILPVMFFSAIIEIVGIAFVAPFMALAANPKLIEISPKIAYLYQASHLQSQSKFLMLMGIVVLLILVVSNIFSAFVLSLIIKFTYTMEHQISIRLLEEYLKRPYVYFLSKNSAVLSKNILHEVNVLSTVVVYASMLVISKFLAVAFIAVLLLFIYSTLAIATTLLFASAYFLLYSLTKKKISKANRIIAFEQERRHQLVSEIFGGIKDIKLLGNQHFYTSSFEKCTKKYQSMLASVQIIAQMPKFLIETIAFGAVVMMVVYLLYAGQSFSNIIPALTVFTFAGYRLMPAIQMIFSSITNIKGALYALEIIYEDLRESAAFPDVEIKSTYKKPCFNDRIELRNLSFRYPGSKELYFNKINLAIEAKTTIAFVGPTGAGKTTLIDILLGLLRPYAGELLIDNHVVTDETLPQWQQLFGYVPQQIYLIDDTLRRNIAFGLEDTLIDIAGVERAAKLANIHDFIVKELPEGYETRVGERGVRLSGGQRQRIGIARALYRNPSILVLDEATSALDGITEGVIMEAINNLNHSMTMIIIAHRLSTIKKCDIIYMIEKGCIVAQGKYEDLIEKKENFRKMASVE